MRTYLTVTNLQKAAVLGVIIGLVSIPRIIIGNTNVGLLAVSVFPVMTLVAGAVTAWGGRGGMCGPFPDRKRMITGVIAALILGLAITPFLFLFDSDILQLIHADKNSAALALAFPPTASGCLALVLWSAGFETVFFQAATMSVLSRLTGRQWLAIAGAVSLRLLVGFMKADELGLSSVMMPRLAAVALVGVMGCMLYARGGLPAAMAFAAVLSSRHFVRLILG